MLELMQLNLLNLLLKNMLSIARQISQVDMATGNTGNKKAEQMFL